METTLFYLNLLMATVEELKNRIIDKVKLIRDEDVLLALEQFVSSDQDNQKDRGLTEEQKLMLAMSEEDIKYGRTTPHEEVEKRVDVWLKNNKFY